MLVLQSSKEHAKNTTYGEKEQFIRASLRIENLAIHMMYLVIPEAAV